MDFLKAYTANIYKYFHIFTPYYDLLIILTLFKFAMHLSCNNIFLVGKADYQLNHNKVRRNKNLTLKVLPHPLFFLSWAQLHV